eukprot:1955527-Amphidinium_carterae.1
MVQVAIAPGTQRQSHCNSRQPRATLIQQLQQHTLKLQTVRRRTCQPSTHGGSISSHTRHGFSCQTHTHMLKAYEII